MTNSWRMHWTLRSHTYTQIYIYQQKNNKYNSIRVYKIMCSYELRDPR